MVWGRVCAALFALYPATLLACKMPPQLEEAFQRDSLVVLEGCDRLIGNTCPKTGITSAWYAAPTERYRHGVLGDAIEGGQLVVRTAQADGTCVQKTATLDDAHVFEDIAPRLFDVDDDEHAEVIAVRSNQRMGAQLTIWDDDGTVDGALEIRAATPFIGRSNRWLSPVGAADLDGDGFVEIAYVDRPHLAKTLRVWRYKDGALTEVANLTGLSNHRIGEPFISGGIRNCGAGPEMITADAGWRRIMASQLKDGQIISADIGPFEGSSSFQAAMDCR